MKEQRTCTIDGCERPHKARGLCGAHYEQVRRGREPEPVRSVRPAGPKFSGIDRVLEIARMEPTGECVLWPVSSDSRPKFTTRGKQASVARTVLALTAGPPPTPEHEALHEPVVCANPHCVAPWHLRWGTHTENMADRKLDGTAGKLTTDQVRAIRRDPRLLREIAAAYGIGVSAVGRIKRREAWASID